MVDKTNPDFETGCCKRFDPKPWDDKTISFGDKLFVKRRVVTAFHIPITMDQVMKDAMEKITAAGALAETPIMLYDDCSLFGADIYIHVSKPVPGEKLAKFKGSFLSKVFEGDYSQTGNWVKAMEAYVAKKGKSIQKLYFFYTMCPACAKAYGQNYTVLLAKAEP